MSTKTVAFIGVFGALHVILYYTSFGLWRNWAIYLEPIEGIVLGPWAGFLAALLGSVTARVLRPTEMWMFGTIAEPLGVLACGFLARGKWKPIVGIFTLMLASYFIHPLGRWLPLWTVLDILLAFALIYPTAKLSKGLFVDDFKRLSLALIPLSFVGTASDALARVFLLIPGGFSTLFGWSPDVVHFIFIAGAIDSYIEDVLDVTVSFLIGVPLLTALRKMSAFEYPLK